MKKLLLFSVLTCFLIACTNNDDNDETPDNIVFGQFYGFCVGQCFKPYQLTNIRLTVDDDEEHYMQGYTYKPTDVLDATAFREAKHLLEDIPDELLNAENGKVYGCPDCADQGGVYLELNFNRNTKIILIDNFDSEDQSDAILTYKNKIKNVLEALQN
jgi:hypothetical protein